MAFVTPPIEPKSITSHIARGAAWMVAMRWLMRGIGLINTVVVARILSPDDFGVIAMAAVMVELLMMLGDTSVDIALLRDPGISREIYDSAWTVQMMFGFAVAILVCIAAPFLAIYYRDPRVEFVAYILALRPVILGFENVGVVEFRKALDFAKEFRYWIFRRLSLVVFSLALALTLRNYLALAIAAPVSAIVAVVFSFTMSSYRPRFCLVHAAFVWSSSRWLILQNVAQTALDRTDEFIIGGVATSTDVGNYYVASQVAPMPTRELAWPVERALMPTYSKITDEPEELRRTIISVMAVMGVICFSAGLGIMTVAEDLILTIFGRNWTNAIPFFQWLAVFGIFAGLGRPLMPMFYALKRERAYALLCLLQVAVTVPILVFAARNISLVAIAAGRTIVAGIFFAIFCWWASRISAVKMTDFAKALWRPALAGIVMAFCVHQLHDGTIPWPIVSLLRDVAIGAVIFIIVQLGLWFAAGRPQGPERLAWDYIGARVRR